MISIPPSPPEVLGSVLQAGEVSSFLGSPQRSDILDCIDNYACQSPRAPVTTAATHDSTSSLVECRLGYVRLSLVVFASLLLFQLASVSSSVVRSTLYQEETVHTARFCRIAFVLLAWREHILKIYIDVSGVLCTNYTIYCGSVSVFLFQLSLPVCTLFRWKYILHVFVKALVNAAERIPSEHTTVGVSSSFPPPLPPVAAAAVFSRRRPLLLPLSPAAAASSRRSLLLRLLLLSSLTSELEGSPTSLS